MKLKIRNSLFVGAIAALIAGPIWAASDTAKDGATHYPDPAKSGSGQSERGQPTAAQPTSQTPSKETGPADHRTTVTRSMGDNPLYSRSAKDFDGVEVVDRTGNKIGEIKQIVLAPDRKSAHAVVSAGAVLGVKERNIRISLDDLTPFGDKLQMSSTKEEATAMKDEAPDADNYVEVKGDTPISGSIVEFSAFEVKDPNKSGAASTTPEADADKMTHPAIAPKGDADNPATTPETPRLQQ